MPSQRSRGKAAGSPKKTRKSAVAIRRDLTELIARAASRPGVAEVLHLQQEYQARISQINGQFRPRMLVFSASDTSS